MKTNDMKLTEATKADFDNLVLHDPQAGIFHGVSEATLDYIRSHTKIRTFEREELVFSYREDTETLPVYIVLSGKFAVEHELYGLNIEIASDEAGVILADVELFVRDVDAKVYGRGEANRALSTVICTEAGEALMISPPGTLWEGKSFELARNMGKLVCFKLLRRNNQTDARNISETRRLIIHLHELVVGKHGHKVKWRQLKINKDQEAKSKKEQRLVYIVPKVSQKEVASKLGIAPSTINGIAQRLYEYDEEFYWHLGKIDMTPHFYEMLKDEEAIKTLWERKPRPRSKTSLAEPPQSTTPL